jgi:diacylglycerol kinase family enzyme
MPTTGPETAGQIARGAIAEGARIICVAGGDGTINEVAAGMAGTGVPLAVLPAGTANVLAMETGIGGNTLRAAERFAELEPHDVNLGIITAQGRAPRLFATMAGAGLDARIVRLVSPETKRRWGKLSYWEGGFAQLGKRLPEFDISVDGRTSRASFALISRVRNYGGDLEIARHANLLADDFAVVLFEGPSTIPYLKYFSGVLLNVLERMKGVTVARARSLEIAPCRGAEIDIQVDGEHTGYAPARIEIAPQTLRLMLPRKFVESMRARLPRTDRRSNN